MKPSHLILLVIPSLLLSCAAIQPGIPMNEVPAAPFLQALDRRVRSFFTLKTTASLQIARKERRRVFDNAGILVQGRDRFRIEAYGPLGETVMTLLWAGQDVLLDLEGTVRVMPPKNSGLDRILGSEVDPADLADILAGNVPGMSRTTRAKLLCPVHGGACVLELNTKELVIRVHPEADWESKGMVIRSCEILRKGSLVYQVRYESVADIAGYLLPKKITVENPDKQVVLTFQYFDAEVNAPLDAQDFTPPGGGTR